MSFHERFLCDYRATMADLILDNFTKEWTHWSNENLLLTMEQAHGSPSNCLDMYAAADIPQCESFGPSCFNIDKVRVMRIHDEFLIKGLMYYI